MDLRKIDKKGASSPEGLSKPSLEFTVVAIGGPTSWRSKEMEKIKAANASDVVTTIKFILPFPLLRLSDGVYELKEGSHNYSLSISRHSREPTISKSLTGWTPMGDIEIIGDRFGRFSFSRIEITIPYRLLDYEMFDYICPNCKLEVEKSTKECSVCGEVFSPEKARVPPRKKEKIKAIELVNKFLDAYRFFFKDYFIEHIRYDDIISYEIEYKMVDGTKASWTEDFNLSPWSRVKVGCLSATQEQLETFRKFLAAPEERMVLRDYLLSSAANRITTEEYHLAILESVIALEITLSEYIINETMKLGLPKNKNEDFIRYIGSYGNIKVILKLLTKDKPQLSSLIYEKCEKAIQKRNKIVHRAERAVTYKEAKDFLWHINKMIEYIVSLS